MSEDTVSSPRGGGYRRCHVCDAGDLERLIERCVTCRNHYCLRCAARHNGKRFCSRSCAEIFFFNDEE